MAAPEANADPNPSDSLERTRPSAPQKVAAFVRRHPHAVGVIIVFAAAILAAGGDLTTRYISLWDEGFHLSYVQYVTEGSIPRRGEVMSLWARDAYACHELFPNGFVSSTTCNGDYAPGLFPDGGGNSAASWPPGYYLVAGLLVKAFLWTGVEPLYLARVATALIWATGLGVLALAAMKVSGSAVRGTAVGVAIASLPISAYMGAFVGPHSAQPLVAGVSILVWFWLFEARTKRQYGIRSLMWVVTVTIVTLTLPHALSLVGALAIAAVVRMMAVGRTARLPGVVVVASAGLGVLAFEGWSWVQEQRRVPLDDRINPDTFIPLGDVPFHLVSSTLVHWWDFWPSSIFDYPFQGTYELFISRAWTLLMVMSVGIVLYHATPRSPAFQFAIGVLVGAPIAASALDAILPYGVPIRYGLSVGLLGFILIAWPRWNPAATGALVVAALVSWLLSLGTHPFV